MGVNIDEILSDDSILLNEALMILKSEIDGLSYFSQKEIKEDLAHALLF